ncbi:hypothetical protein D3C80_2228020 [compost metagenome]
MVGKVPALLSLGVTFGLLLGGVVVSLVKTREDKATVEGDSPEQAATGQTTAVKTCDTKQNSVS